MNIQEELVCEIEQKIREIRQSGMTVEIWNWKDIIQEKAARMIAEEKKKDVNLFPTLIMEQCLMKAQEEFSEEKANGKYDSLNCEVM